MRLVDAHMPVLLLLFTSSGHCTRPPLSETRPDCLFLSGWCRSALFLNAARTSDSVAFVCPPMPRSRRAFFCHSVRNFWGGGGGGGVALGARHRMNCSNTSAGGSLLGFISVYMMMDFVLLKKIANGLAASLPLLCIFIRIFEAKTTGWPLVWLYMLTHMLNFVARFIWVRINTTL